MHRADQRIRLELLSLQRAQGNTQDATEDDHQSRRETQVFCVWEDSIRSQSGTIVAGGKRAASAEKPTSVLWLWSSRAAVRPPGAAAIRVRAVVGTGGIFRVPHATCELLGVRSQSRVRAVGTRVASARTTPSL